MRPDDLDRQMRDRQPRLAGTTPASAIDCFRWRQADATRCALNGWCYLS